MNREVSPEACTGVPRAFQKWVRRTVTVRLCEVQQRAAGSWSLALAVDTGGGWRFSTGGEKRGHGTAQGTYTIQKVSTAERTTFDNTKPHTKTKDNI